jgi:hypothetical protein
MSYIINEDRALKKKLSGIVVQDANAYVPGRPIKVRYRLPENEIAEMVFPSIIIEHAGITKESDREHRGFIQIPYAPEGYPLWDGDQADISLSPYWSDFPIPVGLDYQITVYARKFSHVEQIMSTLVTFDYLPFRFGYLAIPEDGTVRRLDVLGSTDIQSDKDQEGKRIFRIVYSVRVSSELLMSQIQTFHEALTVDVNLDLTSWS